MLTLLLLACDPEFSAESNLCGTISRPSGAPGATGVDVVEVLDGEVACQGGDTGGGGWWGAVEASPTPKDDTFEATVEPGSYGVEVYTSSGYGGCAAADVPDTSTCAASIEVVLQEEVSVDKPNLYLYPTEPSDVAVRLPAWRRITESDPRYPVDGWRVTAQPDGLLETPVGDRDFLFYEMNYETSRFQHDSGWCVQGSLAQLSIESAMDDLGFLSNEIADFTTAWDGIFPDATPGPGGRAMMTVYPQYDNLTPVRIDPEPDSFLRVWFVVADGCQDVELPEVPQVPRVGFHAAEWGVAFERPLAAPVVIVHGG
ncbi:MAG: hypothetical protein EXR69_02505 [Myxococcales bacterium]|nr:hypothetical protein [Myxococcales bacterium]